MPYSYPDNIPDYIKNLPGGAQRVFVSAYNSVFEKTQDEDQARIAGWGAVKNLYEQNAEGEWVRKAKEMAMIDLTELDSVQKAYAAHNRIHAEYVDARHGQRRKAQIQEDHESVVKHILELGGRHLPKGDTLDDTLPQDLREPVKLRYFTDFEFNEAEELNKIQVLRTGTFHHPTYGKFTITEETLATMVKNFGEIHPKPPTELVVDYDHLSVDNREVWQGKAAGWIKSLVQETTALFALVEWTSEAAEAIKQKLFRFVSPEFTLNYADKESGKKVGPVILSAALTNRPFLEGMQPVVLNEAMSAVLCAEESLYEQIDEVHRAYQSQFGSPHMDSGKWVREIYEDHVIVEEDDKMYKLPYRKEGEEFIFDTESKVEVTLTKTYDEVLTEAAPEAGIGEPSELSEEQIKSREDKMEETKLRETLGIGEDADIEEAVQALKTKVTEQESQLTGLQGDIDTATQAKDAAELKLNEEEADKAVVAALFAGKITPKMEEWAKTYALKDPESFKAFIATAEKVGPELKELGGGEEEKTEITPVEEAIAAKMGVSKESIIALKEADKEAAETK